MAPFKEHYAVIQDQGQRDYQEDDYGVYDHSTSNQVEHTLLLLADGMGGEKGGALASEMIIKTINAFYPNFEGLISDRLRESTHSANYAIRDYVEKNRAMDGMGATLVAAVVTESGLEWVSAGDSLLWLFRDGKLQRLNADHSMKPVLQELVKLGRMTAEEAATDSSRHTLRSALNGDELQILDISSQAVELQAQDLIVLASDGIETLDKDKISKVLSDPTHHDLNEKAEALIASVNNAGKDNQDNTTVILYQPMGFKSAHQVGTSMAHDREEKKSLFPSYLLILPIIFIALLFIQIYQNADDEPLILDAGGSEIVDHEGNMPSSAPPESVESNKLETFANPALEIHNQPVDENQVLMDENHLEDNDDEHNAETDFPNKKNQVNDQED